MVTQKNNKLPPALSIVIIAKNEAGNIARGIESVLKAAKNIPNFEVLLVDSASTDNTVEIAKRYPINIVRLAPSWFKSVSAGRFIGMHYTRGELVLHMDGDMELDPQWIERSVAYMQEHPEVGAVGGYWRNIHIQGGDIIEGDYENRDPLERILEARYVGGAALYRRCAIENMGGFQPFIRGEEGVYLSMGIRYAGYKVVLLPYLMSRHYCIPRHSYEGGLRKLKLGFVYGYGQVLRSYVGSGIFWMYLKERCLYSSAYFAVVIATILAALLTIFTKNALFIAVWSLIMIGVILAFAVKKRSLQQALLSCVIQTWVAYGVLRGFLLKRRSSAEYPTNAEIVKVCHHKGGLA